jgi:hypothetical protein
MRPGIDLMTTRIEPPRANKTDAGNGSKAICRVSHALRSPSPDPRRSLEICEPMNPTLIDGLISDLEQSTLLSGDLATMTHVSIFNLLGDRVILKTAYPAMIANGDHLRLAGVRHSGCFAAAACKNITTGWMTTFKMQVCATLALVGFGLVSIALTFLFPAFILMTICCIAGLFFIVRTDSRRKTAHEMLNQ